MVQLLKYENLILNAVRSIFMDQPEVLASWEANFINITSGKKTENTSKSFNALLFIIDKIATENDLLIRDIEKWIYEYEDDVLNFVQSFINQEKQTRDDQREVAKNNKVEVVSDLLEREFTETGSAYIYHKLRETISKNEFNYDENYPTAYISNETNSVEAIAQVRTNQEEDLFKLSKQEIEKWKNLTSNALTSMDDLTADIFDIVSILWMKEAQHKDQMIHFHSDDALNLRGLRGRNKVGDTYSTGYRKKERDEIMKRLAALTSIWIKIEKDRLRIIDPESEEFDKIDRVQFNPLFIVDSITIAYRGNVPIGIYECKIKPGEIMAHYLYGSKKSSGYFALKTLQYNPVKQKYHKRLARYLSWQWRIRQKKSDYLRPFSIGGERGILQVIGLEINERHPNRTKETFEGVLDILQKDGVIKRWEYERGYDETSVGTSNKGWLRNYWLKIKVHIEPPTILEELYLKDTTLMMKEQIDFSAASIDPQSIYRSLIEKDTLTEQKQSYRLENITPGLLIRERERRGKLSRLRASKEIGISHSILSRFERGITKPTKVTLKKIQIWLENTN
ncbi:helix-turn-helix domain-containing protein [Priestia endophytica]|uniref:helix-turn-helix domain-containing protein n=1 Tax=Priestia endophytica TaxID=135735 RepID=UPI00203D88FD|nr:helix-turn-helix transcriptional regulator [Priestia endophytica]MCM3541331.1 helix-turn-helix domain-containing protein [Priestia endophytica]